MRYLLLLLALSFLALPVFGAGECPDCESKCYGRGASCNCGGMDSTDKEACKALGEDCKAQCFARGYCSDVDAIWYKLCGYPEYDGPCPGCAAECNSFSDSCLNRAASAEEEEECLVFRGACAMQCTIAYKQGDGGVCHPASWLGNAPDSGGDDAARAGCDGVVCDDYCEGRTRHYGGECRQGECYYSSEVCEYQCNGQTGSCENNMKAPDMIIEATPSSVVISEKKEVDIMVQLANAGTGKAVEGAEVYIRVSDPKQTGLLGDWGFLDVKKYSDSGGIASATLGLPSMKSIDRMHYTEFPLELEVEVTAVKHSGGEDWSATKKSTILVKSPVPKITEMRIDPDPAQAYWLHVLHVEVADEDEGPVNLKYTIRCFGGKLGTHSGETSNSDEYSRVFYSGEKSEGIEWTAPSQGIDENEPVEFKEKMANLEGLSKNIAANRFGIVGGMYKAANGLNENSKNLAYGFHALTKSESWKEAAYRTLDLGLEGFKTFVGVYTLGFKAAPGALGKLSNDAGDLVDAGVGSMQATLRGLAHEARANAAETRTTEYGCAAIVEDEDGYTDWRLYQFELEYEGFESDKQYGKEDEISG